MVVRPVGNLEPLPLTVVRTGSTPISQGEPCAGIWRIETGLLALTLLDEEGRSLLVDVAGPGDPLGAPDGLPAPWTATALRPGRLIGLHGADARAAQAEQTARTAWIAAGFAWFGVVERLERRLGDLAARLGRPVPGGVQIPVRLTQDDLASMVGASRESVNRALARMLRAGAVEVRGRGRYVVPTQLRLVPG